MKKHLLFFALLFCVTLTASAQQQQQPKPQRFDPKVYQQRFELFTAEKAEFSKEEAEQFFKLFNEMKAKERLYYRQYNDIIRKTNTEQSSDKELSEKVAKMNQLQTAMANLEPEYYKKFKKIISDKKYFKFKKAEMLFQARELRERRNNNRSNNAK
ncbi:MAG: hypothetical protein MJZ83_05460 [Bacteroidaceae bacterium]|nr:hypothetical protein [Bacteroidaceae bacterium]